MLQGDYYRFLITDFIAEIQPVRYQLGEAIVPRDRIPTHIIIIYRGQVRLLGCDPRNGKEVTLAKLESEADNYPKQSKLNVRKVDENI